MNYLTHYFFDNRYHQPYYNFGLALPDLMSSAARKWKPVRQHQLYLTPESKNLWCGIEKHLEGDAKFHNGAFFKSNTRAIRLLMEKNGFQEHGVRLFFLAHIVLEIMLDRYILKSWPGIADRFYADLMNVEERIIRAELKNCIKPEYGEFFLYFNRFKQSRYIYHYLDDNQFLFALNRIMKRAAQGELNSYYQQAMLSVLSEAETMLSADFNKYFIENQY